MNDTGEGLYLGGNNATAITHHSVVALNHIHDLFMNQGDGIELKQGSHSCWIAENLVHDTNYPGILAYGTNGAGQNLIERNIVYNSNDNPIQVQGEAIVRNNLAFGRSGFAFSSRDHQGQVTNLEVVSNTFVATTGRAMRLEHWGGKPGMVLANNALYSQSGYALFVQGSLNGASVGGNVVHGQLNPGGAGPFTTGTGLSDFEALAWDGSLRDARPSASGVLVGAADPAFQVGRDNSGATRPAVESAGAFARGTYGRYTGGQVAGLSGEPRLTTTAHPSLGSTIQVSVADARPGAIAMLNARNAFVGIGTSALVDTSPIAWTSNQIGVVSAQGQLSFPVHVPNNTAWAGQTFQASWRVRDASAPLGISRSRCVRWVIE